MKDIYKKPSVNFVGGFVTGIIVEINVYFALFFLLILFFVLVGVSFDWKQDVKYVVEEERAEIKNNSFRWLTNLVATLSGCGVASLLWDYLQL